MSALLQASGSILASEMKEQNHDGCLRGSANEASVKRAEAGHALPY